MVKEGSFGLLNEGALNAVMAAVVDGLIVIDGKGVVLAYSPSCETLFGHIEEDVIGQNIKMLMPEPYQDEHDGYLEHYKVTIEPRIIGIGRNVVGLRKDGSTFPMHLSVGEHKQASGSIFVGTIRDLSDMRAAEEDIAKLQSELRHSARVSAINGLASALSHELNQPLTAISNYLEASRDLLAVPGEENSEVISGFLGDAVQQCMRAGEIIKRARDFTSKRNVVRREQNVENVVREACALTILGFPLFKAEVSFSFDNDLPTVMMDRIQVQQVILNLVRNAIEAMSDVDTPELSVCGYNVGTEVVEVTVSDTGPGLPAELANNPFAPFTTTKEDGLGMGLSICQSIIRSHGGDVSVSSNENSGTTFRFTLSVDGGEGHDDE